MAKRTIEQKTQDYLAGRQGQRVLGLSAVAAAVITALSFIHFAT